MSKNTPEDLKDRRNEVISSDVSKVNCFAWAFRMIKNPETKKNWEIGGYQPGKKSGKMDYLKIKNDGKNMENYANALIDAINSDNYGFMLTECSEDSKSPDSIKVALFIKNNGKGNIYLSHVATQEKDGIWTDKPGYTSDSFPRALLDNEIKKRDIDGYKLYKFYFLQKSE